MFRDTCIVRFVVDGCRKNLPLYALGISPIVGPVQLQHPNGFDDAMFACFNAQCRIWTSQLNAYADGWHHLGFNGEPPTWEFGDPEIAPDRSYVSLPLGNSFTYGHVKLFLDTFPENLYSHFPLDFRADLECRVSPDADWTSVVDLERNARQELLRLAKLSDDAPA